MKLLRNLLTAAAVVSFITPAMAATPMQVVVLGNPNRVLCTSVSGSPNPYRDALIACLKKFGVNVPTANAFIETTRTCRSGYRITPLNGQPARWGFVQFYPQPIAC